jgi:integrase/recombinase XerD
MNQLRHAVREYVAVRRSLGFKLETQARILRGFVAFAEREGAAHVTTPLVLRWIGQPSKAQEGTWATRLSVVRCFARWWSSRDPQTEMPPQALMPTRKAWRRPHTYHEDDVPRLLAAAARMRSRLGLRGPTYMTIFGLIAATGLRVSEALALDRGDVDLDEALLTIRRTKFGKDRLVPIHSTTADALKEYAARRDSIFRSVSTKAFFVAESGRRVTDCAARYSFAKLSQRTGLRQPVPRNKLGHGPRIHDLRHRFAVRTLVDWYRAGKDVDREIPKLAAYLGHSSVAGTYWYVEAVPELLLLAAERQHARSEQGASP